MSFFKSKFPKSVAYISAMVIMFIGLSIAHDMYVSNKDGSRFYFAHIGRIFEKYFPTAFDKFTQLVSVEQLNGPLEPIMALPLTFVLIGALVLFILVGVICMVIKREETDEVAANQAPLSQASSYKSRALPKRH